MLRVLEKVASQQLILKSLVDSLIDHFDINFGTLEVLERICRQSFLSEGLTLEVSDVVGHSLGFHYKAIVEGVNLMISTILLATTGDSRSQYPLKCSCIQCNSFIMSSTHMMMVSIGVIRDFFQLLQLKELGRKNVVINSNMI